MPSRREVPVVKFPGGDLTLVIGPSEAEFVVRSDLLSRASPVFKIMFSAGWHETKPTGGEWEPIHLPEDHPAPFGVLLNILHGNIRQVPRSVSKGNFDNILVQADKYSMIHVLRPAMDLWLPEKLPDLPHDSLPHAHLLVLYRAYHFGHEERFHQITYRLLTELPLETIINLSAVELDADLDPLLDAIERLRHRLEYSLVHELGLLAHILDGELRSMHKECESWKKYTTFLSTIRWGLVRELLAEGRMFEGSLVSLRDTFDLVVESEVPTGSESLDLSIGEYRKRFNDVWECIMEEVDRMVGRLGLKERLDEHWETLNVEWT